ncbi:hypothetical protein T484DRAFT_1966585 [Baffinella frigidus]|nr:hypothetical protein T484DRAFT_1966585 [Cryptophyta sp. CCMP2293]
MAMGTLHSGACNSPSRPRLETPLLTPHSSLVHAHFPSATLTRPHERLHSGPENFD